MVYIIVFFLLVAGQSPVIDAKAVVPDQVDRLLHDLQDSNWIAASRAVEELVELGEWVVPRLLPLLDHEMASVRYRVVEVLGKIGREADQAVPSLEQLQWDGTMHVAAAAGRALAAIDGSFPTAGGMRQLMSDQYPWLLERPVEDLLFFEAVHGDFKLFGFGSQAYAVDYSSDHTAFFLLRRQEDGVFGIMDLSGNIDSTRVYHRTRNLKLPAADEPAILLASGYFTPEILPAHYVLDHRGVLLKATGEWLLWDEEEDLLTLTTVTPADWERTAAYVAWDADASLPPVRSECPWSQEDFFRIAAYERLRYRYAVEAGLFVLDSAEPISFWAVLLQMVEGISANVWDWMDVLLTAPFAEELRNKGTEAVWDLLYRMGREALLVQGYAAADVLQVRFVGGPTLHVHFDRTYDEAYQSKRVPWNQDGVSEPWVGVPLIRDITVKP